MNVEYFGLNRGTHAGIAGLRLSIISTLLGRVPNNFCNRLKLKLLLLLTMTHSAFFKDAELSIFAHRLPIEVAAVHSHIHPRRQGLYKG